MNRKIAGFRVAQEGDPQCEYHSLCRSGHIVTPAYTTRLFLCQSAYMAYILRGIHQLHAGKRNGGGVKGLGGRGGTGAQNPIPHQRCVSVDKNLYSTAQLCCMTDLIK